MIGGSAGPARWTVLYSNVSSQFCVWLNKGSTISLSAEALCQCLPQHTTAWRIRDEWFEWCQLCYKLEKVLEITCLSLKSGCWKTQRRKISCTSKTKSLFASSDGILQIWFIVMGLCHGFMQITVCFQPPVFCIYVGGVLWCKLFTQNDLCRPTI